MAGCRCVVFFLADCGWLQSRNFSRVSFLLLHFCNDDYAILQATENAKAVAAVADRTAALETTAGMVDKELTAQSGRISANAAEGAKTADGLQSMGNRVSGLEFRSKDLGSLFSLAAATDARSKQNSGSLSSLAGSISAVQTSVSEYEAVKVYALRAEQRSRDNADDVDDLTVRMRRQEDVAADLGKKISTQVDTRISAVESTANAAKGAAAANALSIAAQATEIKAAAATADFAKAAAAAAASDAASQVNVVDNKVVAEVSRASKAERELRQQILDLAAATVQETDSHDDALASLHEITKGQAAVIEACILYMHIYICLIVTTLLDWLDV